MRPRPAASRSGCGSAAGERPRGAATGSANTHGGVDQGEHDPQLGSLFGGGQSQADVLPVIVAYGEESARARHRGHERRPVLAHRHPAELRERNPALYRAGCKSRATGENRRPRRPAFAQATLRDSTRSPAPRPRAKRAGAYRPAGQAAAGQPSLLKVCTKRPARKAASLSRLSMESPFRASSSSDS